MAFFYGACCCNSGRPARGRCGTPIHSGYGRFEGIYNEEAWRKAEMLFCQAVAPKKQLKNYLPKIFKIVATDMLPSKPLINCLLLL